MGSRQYVFVFAGVCALVHARSTHAQTSGSIIVAAGTSTDTRGVRSNAVTIAPSVVLSNAHAAMLIGGSATQFQNDVWAAGGNLAAVTRTSITNALALVLNGSASTTRTSYDAGLYFANATPTAELVWRNLTVYGGARAAAGRTTIASAAPLGLFDHATGTTSATRASVAPVYGVTWRPSSHVRSWIRAEHFSVENDHGRDVNAGVGVTLTATSLTASAGVRNANVGSSTFGSVTVSRMLGENVSLEIAGMSYAANPFTGTSGGKTLTAALAVRFGKQTLRSRSYDSRLPTPTGVTAPAAGMTRLSIRASSAQKVEIAGDWNGWHPAPALRASNGVWYADIALAPGEYRYSFRIDGREWRAPQETASVDDGFGGTAAYVKVHDVRGR